MSRTWTHGVWTVKPGREDEFVGAWQEMARAGQEQFEPAEPPRLLRDCERPNVFVSFGSWADGATIERFRTAMESRFDAIEELLESFEASTLDEVSPGG